MSKWQCIICTNSYESKYICKKCREDPANEGWVEGYLEDPLPLFDDNRELPRTPWGEQKAWHPTETHKKVVSLLFSDLTNEEIAEELGLSVRRIQQIVKEFGFSGK